MGDDLEARLQSHARAFEGLMSLIPAKEYYGKDESITSTQWQKTKKQTKEERRAAKRAKLDPASHKTAKDVMDENARKRKRELEGDGESNASSDIDLDIEKEKPLEGLRAPSNKLKKQKTEKEVPAEANAHDDAKKDQADIQSAKAKANADKRKQKLEKKKEKSAKQKEKLEEKKALQQQFSTSLGKTEEPKSEAKADEWEDEEEAGSVEHDEERMDSLDVSGLVEEPVSTATPSSANSNASTTSVVSAASSSSSIPPVASEGLAKASNKQKESKAFVYNPEKHEAFQSRLNAKLEAMRAARKADGPDGRPARNRAELIEARRKKQAERKAAKKASRLLAKEDEARLQAEEQLARLRGGSGSPSLFPRTPDNEENNFSFGRVAWKDGQQLDNKLSGFLEGGKKKGRSDPKTALEAAEKKRARLNALDETKRKDIEEKDMWLNAKKRAQGEKVHDDANLLKKSLKRQEKEKAKSKQEWKDRLTSVKTGQVMKQKRREANLQKRRDEKGSKGKGKKVKKPGKKVKRPGFEGTFKAR